MSGGARAGAGRRPSGASRERVWLREQLSDSKRKAKFLAALDKQLDEGGLEYWFRAYAQAFGNPPQALDVNIGGSDGQPLSFVLPGGFVLPTSATAVPDRDGEQHGEE